MRNQRITELREKYRNTFGNELFNKERSIFIIYTMAAGFFLIAIFSLLRIFI